MIHDFITAFSATMAFIILVAIFHLIGVMKNESRRNQRDESDF